MKILAISQSRYLQYRWIGSIGISNIQNRVSFYKRKVELSLQINKGTFLNVEIPLEE